MKTLRMFAVFAVVAMSLFAVAAEAQEIAVYFGSEMSSTKQVKSFEPFDVMIVVDGIDDTINAVEYKLNLPDDIIVMGSQYWNGTTLVIGGANAVDGTAVALGECVNLAEALGEQTSIVVATLEAMAVNTFSQAAVTISEFTGTPSNPATAPRYNNCVNNQVYLTPVNGTLQGVTVPTEQSSFSRVKSLF
ncbi:hypothetical protein DRQ53_05725 [bacterium]|nr:MAG: hypothetical protein DRQ32_07030 [bacterium]RKZ16665.1 MAG: hypothetical protein DRQ53_05725 [bacterium]